MEKEFIKNLLMREVIPATGCTEVGGVALAAGWAMEAFDDSEDRIEELTVEVDEGTYKNGLGVGIPGTGETGLEFAAAMGVTSAGKVRKGLQILENPDHLAIERARTLVQLKKVRIIRTPPQKEILILAKVHGLKHEASAIIHGSHDHVVAVERNGKPWHEAPTREEDFWKFTEKVKNLNYSDLIHFVKSMDVSEFPIINQAMRMNVHFASEAQAMQHSLNIGKAFKKYEEWPTGGGLSTRVQHITAIAVEARMKGLDLPVMSCAGSGNQGLVATLPITEGAKVIKTSEECLLRALTLSYLTTIYIKAYTGLLSPVCGCGLAAAVGAGCGLVFLLGGDVSEIEAQVINMVGTMAGIICDGAKSGCAMKALMAVGLAVESAYLSKENVRIPSKEGIIAREVTETLRNLQQIIEKGMPSMDSVIVELMETKGVNEDKGNECGDHRKRGNHDRGGHE